MHCIYITAFTRERQHGNAASIISICVLLLAGWPVRLRELSANGYRGEMLGFQVAPRRALRTYNKKLRRPQYATTYLAHAI